MCKDKFLSFFKKLKNSAENSLNELTDENSKELSKNSWFKKLKTKFNKDKTDKDK